MMTEEEKIILDLLADDWNKFVELKPYHTDDIPEFRAAIHRAQNIVLSRAGARSLYPAIDMTCFHTNASNINRVCPDCGQRL